MPIHEENQGQQQSNPNMGGAQQPNQGGYQQQQAPNAQARQTGGLGNLNQQFKRSGRTEGNDARSSEALQVFTRMAEEAIAQQDLVKDFDILRFDRDQNQVGMASILIVKQIQDAQNNLVLVVRPIILENNQIRLKPRVVTINNGLSQETIESEPLAQDVFTAQYWGKICEYVRQVRGQPKALVHSAGPRGLYGDFDLKDEVLVKQLLIKSVNLCDDLLARLSGEQPFSVATHLVAEGEAMTARVDFSGHPVHDTAGNPIRSDMTVSLNRVKKQGQQDNEFYDADSSLNQVSLFVNLEYTPQPQQQVFGQQQQVALPPFTPAIVVTDVRQASWIKANTPELYFYALTNAFRVTIGQTWARSLLPQVGKVKDLRDIGALGYLSQLGKKIDTKTETFTDVDFANLMNSMVGSKPVFMIDIDRMGDNIAIEGLFLEAMGGPNKQKAVEAIIRHCNNLFAGQFSKYFDHTTQEIIQSYGTEIATGFYIDENGEKQDIRNLDVLGALNASEGNQQEWLSWYGTLCNRNIHPELRMKQHKNYDRMYLSPNVTYTGRVHRGIFNPKFIEALDAAGVATGVNVSMDNLTQVFGAQRFTGNTSIGQFVVSGTAQVSSAQGQTGQWGTPTYGMSGIFY